MPPLLSHLIDAATGLWIGFLGAAVGSFLNVVAYRMPRGMSIIWKPSHCPKCSHPIRAYDNVPVLGWLMLRGRCRDCRQPISARYALVELMMGILFVILAYAELFSAGANLSDGPISHPAGALNTLWIPVWPLIGLVVFHALLLSLLMAIVLVDQDNHRAPPGLVLSGLALGLLPALMGLASVSGIGFSSPTPVEPLAMLIHGLLGLAAGSGLAVAMHGAMGWFCHRPLTRKPLNLTLALALIGLFLGWRALVCITAMSGVLGLARGLILGNKLALKSKVILPALLLATLAYLVFWKHLAALI
jgi:leader peptidase (prepilin peptidase) / N-methyltransferase